MKTLLVSIEFGGASGRDYHVQPYRVASSEAEAVEMMEDYLRIGPDNDWPCPEFFLLHEEAFGHFRNDPKYYDPNTCKVAETADVESWLRETGRI